MWPNEIIITSLEFNIIIEKRFISGMTGMSAMMEFWKNVRDLKQKLQHGC